MFNLAINYLENQKIYKMKEHKKSIDELTIEEQLLLLEIFNNNSISVLKDIAADDFTTFNDIDHYVHEIDRDVLYDEFYDNKLTYTELDELLTKNLSNKDILYMLRDNLDYNYNISLMPNTIDDEYKIEILTKLYEKYTSYQLEEKVKDLI